ncbi:PCC domain-containing protein [Parapusillimonas sp. JC17]|uniref:PCC domain-containing protein n=1 Tax=Parapusillimonas sp. JC17 TaxID=3445768 RepID=UPI003FA15319
MNLRFVEHPGAVPEARATRADGWLETARLELEPGLTLLDALVLGLEKHNARSATLSLQGGAFGKLAYVMPATSSSPDHAVYFSGRYDPPGAVRLHEGCVTYGIRDDGPWLHCHASWTTADGKPGCGHILPNESLIAEAIQADAWLMRGVEFKVTPDPETNFSLFQPFSRPVVRPPDARPAFALRLAPNQDLCAALEAECESRGIREAVLCAGVGSLVGAVFDDGRVVEPHITEVYIRHGRIAEDENGRLKAEIDIRMVDHTGQISEGRLRRGSNAVLVTFELLIEPVA